MPLVVTNGVVFPVHLPDFGGPRGVVIAPATSGTEAFAKALGDPKLALAGSETDASVKNMLGELSGEDGEAGRDPASAGDYNDGIGERDTADLFERVHALHERCLQQGCVRPRKGGA